MTVGGCLGVFAAMAFASPPPGAAGFDEAARQYDRLAVKAYAAGQMPRLADPLAGPVLRRLSDGKAVLGSGTYGPADLGPLTAICGKVNEVTVKYTMHGIEELKPLAGGDRARLAEAVRQLETKNAREYEDEIVPLLAFSLRCMDKELPALTAFTASLKPDELTAVRIAGIEQFRSGAISLVVGAVQMLIDPDIGTEHKALMAESLADAADNLLSALTIVQRQSLADMARSSKDAVDAEYRAPLGKFIAGGDNRACNVICSH
jgi:hypothetical protein